MILDDDVVAFLREQSRISNRPLKEVINETLRLGMERVSKHVPDAPFRIVPNSSGFVDGIDTTHLNRLNDELEIEIFLAENSQRLCQISTCSCTLIMKGRPNTIPLDIGGKERSTEARASAFLG